MGRGFQSYINYQSRWGVQVIVEDAVELQENAETGDSEIKSEIKDE